MRTSHENSFYSFCITFEFSKPINQTSKKSTFAVFTDYYSLVITLKEGPPTLNDVWNVKKPTPEHLVLDYCLPGNLRCIPRAEIIQRKEIPVSHSVSHKWQSTNPQNLIIF